MDHHSQYAQLRATSSADNSLRPGSNSFLYTWLILVPLLLSLVYYAGTTATRMFQQVGHDLVLTTPSALASELVSPGQPSIDAGPATLTRPPAPVADVPWGAFAICLCVLLLAACAVAVIRKLPIRQYKSVTNSTRGFSQPKNVFAKRQQLLRVLENDVQALFEGRLEVRHVMSRAPLTIAPTESLEAACELMESKNVQHLAVCDDDGLLIGLLSLHFARRRAQTVGKAMLTSPTTVAPDALLNPTVTQMISMGISCVAVTDERHCVGILTTTDVQLTLQCSLALLFKATSDEPDPGEDTEADVGTQVMDCVVVPVQTGVYQTVS